MSAHQILRTPVGNVIAVFHTGRGRNRAGCSCGWDGPLRMLTGWAVTDAYRHGSRCPGSLPSDPLVVDESRHHSPIPGGVTTRPRIRWWLFVALMPLLLIPVGLLAPEAKALPSNCEQIPWGFLGLQQRQICDSPIRPDGSWERERVIGVPAHYRNATSSCSGGSYYSSCTFYPAGWVEQVTVEDTVYVVFPYNVLANEPGHLG